MTIPAKDIREYYEKEALVLTDHQRMIYFADPWNDYWHLTRLCEIMKVVRNTTFGSFLDVGCAEGFYLKLLSNNSKTGPLGAGLDLAKNYLLKAMVTSPKTPLVQGDAEKLPFRNDSFDLVLCSEVLEHVPDPKTVFRELVRVSDRYIVLTWAGENLFHFVMRKFRLVRVTDPFSEAGHGHINENRMSRTIIPWSAETRCTCLYSLTTTYFPANFLKNHRVPTWFISLMRLADRIIARIPVLSEFGATQIAFVEKSRKLQGQYNN